jgi:hypothetical protein
MILRQYCPTLGECAPRPQSAFPPLKPRGGIMTSN